MFTSRNSLYLFAIFANMLIAYMFLLYRQPFNVDGIVYLHAATIYSQQGLHAASQVYPWPFYSIMLAKMSQWTSLSLYTAAFILNAGLSALLVCFFLALIAACGGTIKHQYFGLALLLLDPFLNHERTNILRDIGYYAFFTGSLCYYIKFLYQRNTYQALLWQISTFIAALFRVEGLVLLFLVPLFSLVISPRESFREKLKDFIKLISLSILVLLSLILLFPKILHFGRLPEILSNLQLVHIIELYHLKISILRNQVLGVLARDNAGLFFTGGMAVVFLGTLINAFGVFSTAWFIYGISVKRVYVDKVVQKGLWIYGISVSLILIGFFLHRLFLSERYVFPLIVLFMTFLVFILNYFYSSSQRIHKILIFLFFIYGAIASFGYFGPSKTYIVDAGEWISKNVPANNKVYLNDAQLAYYANRMDTQSPLALTQLKSYKIIAINVPKKKQALTEQQLIQTIGKPPLKIFKNRRGDQVLIFEN